MRVELLKTAEENNQTSFNYNHTADFSKVARLSWGGGGAFTHFTETKKGSFLSSDVSGIWYKSAADLNWSPLNSGLGEYEITAMHVSPSGNVYALSSRYLYKLSDQKYWQRISPPIATRRNSVSQFITSDSSKNRDSICLIGKQNTAFCNLKETNEWIKLSFASTQKLASMVFTNHGESLLIGLGNQLQLFDLDSKTLRVVASFDTPTQMIKVSASHYYVATTNTLYEFSPDKTLVKLYSAGRNIIKRFICNSDEDYCILGLERNWSAKLIAISKENHTWQSTTVKPTYQFDTSLPYRKWRKNITKTLSLVSTDANLQHLYLSDYWGAYYSVNGGATWHEDVAGAVNTVGTDLLIRDKNIYVATMDNGVVALNSEGTDFVSVFPTDDSKLAGHAWQLSSNDEYLFFTLSPWNSKKNFVGVHNFNSAKTNLINAGLPNSTKSKQAFWAESYVRGIVASNNTVSVISDGDNAGLYTINMPITPDSSSFKPSGNWRGQQKLFKAISINQGQLQVASCNGTMTSLEIKNDFPISGSENTKRTNFCAFNMETDGNITYLLGERKRKATILKIENERTSTLLQTDYGSAFSAMAINAQNPSELFAATVSWSETANSGAFYSWDYGQTWRDVSCVLSHRNGVVSATFSDDAKYLYILQKVGGLISVPVTIFANIHC